ncbi:hypothetical protein ACFWVF_10190 [Streptomyces sp. NPDC058659]|uniref:hypothetical protein n=1 Tax=unclassified Streptomyces TaxID=2593676 RepID=UPI003654B79A
MTDRHALERALREAGVPEAYYWIEGVHEPAPTPPDFVYLRTRPGGAGDGSTGDGGTGGGAGDGGAGGTGRVGGGTTVWETGVYERGAHEAVATHDTEAGACAHLRALLGV